MNSNIHQNAPSPPGRGIGSGWAGRQYCVSCITLVNIFSKKSFPDLDFSPSTKDLSGSTHKRNTLCAEQRKYVKI